MLLSSVALAGIVVLSPIVTSLVLRPDTKSPAVGRSLSQQTNGTTGVSENGLLSLVTQCNANLGNNLNAVSCRNALTKIPRLSVLVTFGERGPRSWDVVLPSRYLSGKYFELVPTVVRLESFAPKMLICHDTPT